MQDESSLAGHLGERAPRTGNDESAEVAEDDGEFAVDVPEDADTGASGACELCSQQLDAGLSQSTARPENSKRSSQCWKILAIFSGCSEVVSRVLCR